MDGAATILHVDLDAFYASVEVVRNPALRGKPVIVGGGVVLAASYEARRHGIHSGMPGGEARKRCPEAIWIRGEFADYTAASHAVFAVLERFTPVIEPISIDEAFLETRGVVRHFGAPATIGQLIRQAVRTDTGLPISVGVARTKFLAKVASRVAKPDGLVVVDPDRELEFLHPLPVGMVWGVGPVTQRRLDRLGIHTVGDLAELPEAALVSWLGAGTGRHLAALSWNRDPRGVTRGRRSGSVGAQSTFGRDVRDAAERDRVLLGLADRVASRLRRKGRAGRCVTVRVRFADFHTVTRSRTLAGPIATTTALYRVSRDLVAAAVAAVGDGRGLRLVGVSVSQLERAPVRQMVLPAAWGGDPAVCPGSTADLRLIDLDTAVDRARERFGRDAVIRSALLGRRRGR